MPCAAISEAPRTQAGRFAPGHSGNPAGRPKGARNRATLAAEALLDENAEALARTLVAASLGGDMATARFLLGRLYPANAERTVTLDVEPGREGDFVHVHARVLRAMLDGEISPKEGLAIARFLMLGAKLAQLQRKAAKPARPAAPVSDLHSATKSAKATRPLPNPPPQAGEEDAAFAPSPACGGGSGRGHSDAVAEPAPVPRLYFSRDALRASTALGRGPVLFPPVNSLKPFSTERAAA